MTRAVTALLLGLALVHLAEAAQARGGCRPRAGFAKASSNGELELIVEPEPCDEAALANGRFPGAIYRLERVGPERKTIWRARSPELHSHGLVASDGDYVITADEGIAGSGITIRNSAGAVIRSLSREEVISIPEQLAGAYWWIMGLDPSEEFLEVKVLRGDASGRMGARRIQLMDGRVIGSPVAPPGFELPRLDCPPHMKLEVDAYHGVLRQECREGRNGGGFSRSYSFEDGEFELVETWKHEPRGNGAFWQRVEGHPGACESIYRDGDLGSERCGEDVEPPAQ